MAVIRKLGSKIFPKKEPSAPEDYKEAYYDSDCSNSAKDRIFSAAISPTPPKLMRAKSMNLMGFVNSVSGIVRHSTVGIKKIEPTTQGYDSVGLETPKKQKTLQHRVSSARSWSRRGPIWTLRRRRTTIFYPERDFSRSPLPVKPTSLAGKSDSTLNLTDLPSGLDPSTTAVVANNIEEQPFSIRQVVEPSVLWPELQSSSLDLGDLSVKQLAPGLFCLTCDEPKDCAIWSEEVFEEQLDLKGDTSGHPEHRTIDPPETKATEDGPLRDSPCYGTESVGNSKPLQEPPLSNVAKRLPYNDVPQQAEGNVDDRRTLPSYLQIFEPTIDYSCGGLRDFERPTLDDTRPTNQDYCSPMSDNTLPVEPRIIEDVDQNKTERSCENKSIVKASLDREAAFNITNEATIELQGLVCGYQHEQIHRMDQDYNYRGLEEDRPPAWVEPSILAEDFEQIDLGCPQMSTQKRSKDAVYRFPDDFYRDGHWYCTGTRGNHRPTKFDTKPEVDESLSWPLHVRENVANYKTWSFLDDLIIYSSTPLSSPDAGQAHIAKEIFRKAAYKVGDLESHSSWAQSYPRSEPFALEGHECCSHSGFARHGFPGCQIGAHPMSYDFEPPQTYDDIEQEEAEGAEFYKEAQGYAEEEEEGSERGSESG